jgi:DNA mismatch repair protein MutL
MMPDRSPEPADTRIRILPPEEVRKIAAGEVIDRPAALVREFLDNAIDAGSGTVELVIEGGGIRRTEVIDDGSGMDREDLELCWRAHATSKIRSLDDLGLTKTLGFRGEALAAAAAVARLEILTSPGGEAWRLEAGPGGRGRVEQARRTKGTSVRALGLFDGVPARKRFLKREGSEAGLCKQIFIDKALAFPKINFRFIQDEKLKLFLPAAASFRERYAAALLAPQEAAFLHEIGAQGRGFRVTILAGGPELFRQDRRQQYVFANGRRIQDFSLLQALEYGVQGWFPNGTHPVGAVYVDIDPALADFNIHPAKREARFTNPGDIHHAVSSALRDFTRRSGMEETKEPGQGRFSFPALFRHQAETAGQQRAAPSLATEALLDRHIRFAPRDAFPDRGAAREAARDALPDRGVSGTAAAAEAAAAEGEPAYDAGPEDSPGTRPPGSLRLAGRLFNLFILVEGGDRLFIIDQHAAHEQILYDRFLSRPIPRQDLLVPIPFTAETGEDDRFLADRREELAGLGIVIEPEEGSWRIDALPAGWKLPDGETVREILNLRNAGENIAERWAATLSCHGAIKDGDYLDDTAALALAEKALALPVPRCPHGRPLWAEITREALFKAVRRL